MKRTARASLLVALSLGFAAATHGATCSVSSVNLAFGNYSQFQVLHNDTSGNISVTCMGVIGEAVAYTISVGSGGGSFGARRMRSSNGALLMYNIYTAATRTTIWGDGSSGTSVRADAYTLTAPSMTRNYAVFGRVFAGQKVPVGAYTDTIVVTLNF